MARLSLSFLSILLVLAVLAVSVPVKRDGENPTKALGLDGTLDGLKGRLMDTLHPNDEKNKESKEEEQASRAEEKKKAAAIESQASQKVAIAHKTEASGKPTPTATPTPSKKLSSGNFVTPTATPSHKSSSSSPNELGKIPIVGGILGGNGVNL